jgi:AraC-like DNA-binding protein
MNFQEFINGFRVAESKRLLIESDMKVAVVAFECGFNSLPPFMQPLKKKPFYPSEYRKLKAN